MSSYVHSIPGRLRIKTALVKKNPQQAARVESLLKSVAGVSSVDSNLVTGSVLVRYSPREVSCEHLLAVLRKLGCLDEIKPVNYVQLIDGSLVKGGRTVGSFVFRQLIEKQIERFALSLVGALV